MSSLQFLIANKLTIRFCLYQPTVPKIPNEIYLSDETKTALCEVLCNKIQVYKELIRGAINLNDDDMDESMEELHQNVSEGSNG